MAPKKAATTSTTSSSSFSTKRRSSTSSNSISRSPSLSSSLPTTKSTLSSSFTSTKSGTGGSSLRSGGKKSTLTGVKTPANAETGLNSALKDEEGKLVKDLSGLIKKSRKIMGPAIHDQDWAPLEVVLRVFDADPDYGPCSNQTRLERFERAQRLGLDPPEEIGTILRSKVGMTRPEYKNSVFSGGIFPAPRVGLSES